MIVTSRNQHLLFLVTTLLFSSALATPTPDATGVDITNDTVALTAGKPICEENPSLRALVGDCDECLEQIPQFRNLGFFHDGPPNDGYSFPEDGFECHSCKVYPHMAQEGIYDKASWSEVGNAVAEIVDGCKRKQGDFGDETTGGNLVIGRNKNIIIDVRNFKIGETSRVMGVPSGEPAQGGTGQVATT